MNATDKASTALDVEARMQPVHMDVVVDGRVYATKAAILLADDAWPDGGCGDGRAGTPSCFARSYELRVDGNEFCVRRRARCQDAGCRRFVRVTTAASNLAAMQRILDDAVRIRAHE
jgi:hypothetical protein